MSKKQRFVVPFFVLAWSMPLFPCLHAQDRLLGIEEMFRLADENSKSIQVFQTGKEAADMEVKAAKSQRLPELNASVSASYWGPGVIWDRNFSHAATVDMPPFGNNFSLELQQTLYAGGSVNSQIELARIEARASELDWQKNRQEVRFLLLSYYLELYKLGNQKKVLQKNLELTGQLIANMQARLEQGTALKNDITRYELQREMLQLQSIQVEDACKIMNYKLVTLLHLPEGTRIHPDTAILAESIPAWEQEQWQEAARQNNLDLQRAQTGMQASEQNVKLQHAGSLPRISIVAADHLDGPVTIEVPVLNNNFNYWYVGIGINYDISSLYKNNRNIAKAKLQARQAQESYELAQEQTHNAVQENYVNLLTAFSELRTQEKNVELADENFTVIRNRYQNELALLTDMLDASNTKLSADLGLVNARINLIFHYYKMKYVTHTL